MNTAGRADLAAAADVILTSDDHRATACNVITRLWTYPELASALTEVRDTRTAPEPGCPTPARLPYRSSLTGSFCALARQDAVLASSLRFSPVQILRSMRWPSSPTSGPSALNQPLG